MKAIVRDRDAPGDTLELSDIDKPDIGEDEVVIYVQAAGMDRARLPRQRTG